MTKLEQIAWEHREQILHTSKLFLQKAVYENPGFSVARDQFEMGLFAVKWAGIGALDIAANVGDFITNHVDLYETPGGKLIDIGLHFAQVFFA